MSDIRHRLMRLLFAVLTAATLVHTAMAPPAAFAQERTQKMLTAIPPNHDDDIKFYAADGKIVKGIDALGRMNTEAGLVLWVAGNQFFAMDEVVGTFERDHPGISVGLLTLPPGLLLTAIQTGGWTYGGKDFPGRPDVYASVNLGHLQKLAQSGEMKSYAIYMHNELQIMVAKGNPKKIQGIDDLARPGLRTSMPNPVNEGIMQFYARKVLERHGMWQAISGGKECVSCQATERNWFTAVHHRETPDRIRDDKSDAGIVWKTEVLRALRENMPVDAVELPPADSLRNEVSYAIGALTDAKHPENAAQYLTFLATPAAQDAYASFGFVKATTAELTLKPIE